MHDQLEQLRRYAITIDSDAGPVKIRLARAREAAEELDEKKFEKLAHGILMTLEDLYNKISAARKDLSRFPTPCPSHEPESSQACSQASSAATGSHDLSQQ